MLGKSRNAEYAPRDRRSAGHLIAFAVRFLGNVLCFFELQLLNLHLLLIFHGSVLDHLHASEEQRDRQV